MGYPLYIFDGGAVLSTLQSALAAIAASNRTADEKKDDRNDAYHQALDDLNTTIQSRVGNQSLGHPKPRQVAALSADLDRFAQLHVDQWLEGVGNHASVYANEAYAPPGSIVTPTAAMPGRIWKNKAGLKSVNKGMLGVIGETLLVATLHHLGHSRDDFVQLRIRGTRFPDFAIIAPSQEMVDCFPPGLPGYGYLPIEIKATSRGRGVRADGTPSPQPTEFGRLKEATTQLLSFWDDAAVNPGPSAVFIASRDMQAQTFNLFLVTMY